MSYKKNMHITALIQFHFNFVHIFHTYEHKTSTYSTYIFFNSNILLLTFHSTAD